MNISIRKPVTGSVSDPERLVAVNSIKQHISGGADRDMHPPLQTGVIDIGAHTVRMDLFELNRSWQAEKLESLSRPFNLGVDVFRNGYISVENISKLIGMVGDFCARIREYGGSHYRIVATSAVREAFNKELVIDRFREAGLALEILEGTTEVTLTYQAVRETLAGNFNSALENAVMLIMGSGSLFVIGVSRGVMCFCQEMQSGTMRFNDTLASSEHPIEQLRRQLKSQRVIRLLDEAMCREENKPVSLVIVGNPARKLAAMGGKNLRHENDCAALELKEFSSVIDDCENLRGKAFRKIDPDDAVELSAAAVIVRHFMDSLPCREIICPGMTTRGAVLRDWVRRCRMPGVDPFRTDLASVCRAIGRRYDFDGGHALNVASASSLIFLKLRPFFSFPENTSLMLEAASYLHDIGRFVDFRHHHKHSWYLLSNIRLPGLTASEHRIVAAAVRYHGRTLPREAHPEYAALSANEKVAVLKLAAILRVADALDIHFSSPESGGLKLSLRGRELHLIVDEDELASMKYSLKVKGGLFEQVFGLELKLHNGEL
ncbi:MAG: HD domain-containing protein [Lentisphaeria bacterium]|nr:HD domain-containing protein [Lentisphaeria bacterium]